jgi:hypothetical protein
MILDKLLQFSSAQAFTATGDTVSTNVVDLGVARNIGQHPGVRVIVSVNTTWTSGGASTLLVALQGSADNATFYDMLVSQTYALAALVQGARLLDVEVPYNAGANAPPRYLRIRYAIGTAVMTGGAIDANMALDTEGRHAYAAGVNIVT